MSEGIQNIGTGLPDLIEEVWETHVLLKWSLEAEHDTLWHHYMPMCKQLR